MTKKELDQDWLVQQAENLAWQLREAGWQEAEQGRTQTSKAVEVAQDAESLRLFVNWLRYQAARESRQQRFWSRQLKKQELAEVLVSDLKAIQKRAASDQIPVMLAVRLYLGYFRRHRHCRSASTGFRHRRRRHH